MTKFMENLKEKELKGLKKISKEEFQKAKENLDNAEFERNYREVVCEFEETDYYKCENKLEEDDDIKLYLQYEIIKINRKIEKHNRVMRNILVIWIICNVISSLLIAIGSMQ